VYQPFQPHHQGLSCDGVSVQSIVDHVGTPAYVYSARAIRDAYDAIDDAFATYPHSIHYALKANSTLAIVRLLHALGSRADANSAGEIRVAQRAGFTPDQIVFTGVGKSREELEYAIAQGVATVNAESAGELDRIAAIARAQGRIARVALRVNPDIDAKSHPHISTGLKSNKFGVPLPEARGIYRARRDAKGIEFVGVHIHIGSQITTLIPELRRIGLPVVLEPGRAVVGYSGALVARVVDTKCFPDGRKFAVLDAGMGELIRPALYGSFHRIEPVHSRPGTAIPVDIVGPICESSDVFARERMLPPLEVDDLVAILDAGAYGSVMGSNYNRHLLPAEVLVDDGKWAVIRRRQTLDDVLALES
jgi:diaminopimelate decarboxylase